MFEVQFPDSIVALLTVITVIQPGSLPVDYIPALQKLPLFLQPWHKQAVAIRTRDFAQHTAVLNVLRGAIKTESAPECFAKMLLEVWPLSLLAQAVYAIF
jgi:hypothetical protein